MLKELTDNALDAGAKVKVGELPKNGYFVEDDGSGIDGTPAEIASLFSISRPMVSTKLLRLPTRGALGNGLRVVASAVLVSDGSLVVITRNRRIELRPKWEDGRTTVAKVKAVKFPVGTRIEIRFGSALPVDGDALLWAKTACGLARSGDFYLGKSSPHWYDPIQFHELLDASGPRPVRELIVTLDGCTGAKAGEIVGAAGLNRALCNNVNRQQAAKLLEAARTNAKPVNPERLGRVGPDAFSGAYTCAHGVARFGATEPKADIPFVVEAWAESDDETSLAVYVNRTPTIGGMDAFHDKRDIQAFGCGVEHTIAQAPKGAEFDIRLNITTPFMPITSDGKAPDLVPFLEAIQTAVGKAVRKAHRPNAGAKTT